MKQFAIPEQINGREIRSLRNRLGLTQAEMAQLCGVSPKTIERWETDKKPLTGAIVPLAELLLHTPGIAKQLEIPPRKTKLRLYYMDGDHICTIIDVDEPKHEVEIKNFATDPQKRAFGRVEYPSFDEYESFLESRCFPRSRDKMKIMLDALDLPFYDPIQIIERTQGRLTDDEQWIRVER